MRPLLLVVLLVSLAGCVDREERPADVSTVGAYVPLPDEPTVFPDLVDDALLAALEAEYAPRRTLGYGPARDLLFAYEMETSGRLEGVYTGYSITLPPGVDASKAADERGINTEHVWPQSYGAHDEPLRSDMHHLFPARQNVNSSRGNLPFGEIQDEETEAWYRLDASQSNTPRNDIDEWSERGAGRFEPRESREGDIARALFYVYAFYQDEVDDDGGAAFFTTMREDLLRWNDLDPPDAGEVARSQWISEHQGAPNPFVLDPTLARRAFETYQPGGRAPQPPPEPSTPADLMVSEIHYDNAGADVNEGVEVVGPAGASLDGWSIALYNGADGSVYRTVRLGGTVPGGLRWVPIRGLQNGAPDGLALVAPDGELRQFLSYEGAFTATGGPAQGRPSADVGAAQDDATPVGQSLQLVGRQWVLAPATPGIANERP